MKKKKKINLKILDPIYGVVGKKIEIEKEDDRFTIIPSNKEQLNIVRNAPGVHDVKPVTNQVFKVVTTAPELDSAMAALRAKPKEIISHHMHIGLKIPEALHFT